MPEPVAVHHLNPVFTSYDGTASHHIHKMDNVHAQLPHSSDFLMRAVDQKQTVVVWGEGWFGGCHKEGAFSQRI